MKRNRRGFTLIELMVVIAIIIILAAIAIPNYISMTHRAQASKATSDAAVIATALEVYRTDTQVYPTTTEGLAILGGYDNLIGNDAEVALSDATLTQIKTNEKTVDYSLTGDIWTLTITTLDGQTVVRKSDASGVTVT